MTTEEDIQPEPSGPTSKPDKQELKHEVIDFVKLVVWFLVIFFTLRTYVIEGYEVQGTSMIPTLENNERILVLKLPQKLSRIGLFSGWMEPIEPGDIVVFDSPDTSNKRYVKRVIALGGKSSSGNTVDAESQDSQVEGGVEVVFNRGEVFVNNSRVEEDYLRNESRTSSDRQRLTLNAGEYYVLGDNRGVSKDSRSFDAVQDDALIGRALLRFWPPSRIGLLK